MKKAMYMSFLAMLLMLGLGYLQGITINGVETMVCLFIMTFLYRFVLMTFEEDTKEEKGR